MKKSTTTRPRCRLVEIRRTLMAVVALVLGPSLLAAQAEDAPEGDGPMIPLLTAVTGDLTRPITTQSERAQAYFDQGLQMIYAFTLPVAIRSFQEAERIDPDCAMCYWGEAKARGPFLNGRLTNANAVPAYEAAQHALSLIDETDDPVEKAMIRAMSIRYAETYEPDTQPARDSAYSQAMAEVYQTYPTDPDVGTAYAESLMLLNTDRANYEASDPFVQSFHRVLEGVLAQDIHHPGACHLYIHATEATEVAGKAEACADLLMTAVPGSSHLNHMPSHTYNVIGRWGKAVRANAMAWRSDEKTAYGEGVSYGATHNLHMLFYAGSMDGQGQVSVAAADAYAPQMSDGVFYQSLVHLRFGEFHKILDLTEEPEQGLRQGLWEFARGYAHLRTGSPDSAAVYLERVDEKAESLPENQQLQNNSGRDLMSIVGNILRGEILRSEGKLDEAIAAFAAATEKHESLEYAEPEALNFSASDWLGAALLEAGRYADAERAYRGGLEQHPNNVWSTYGLTQALRAQGKTAEADAEQVEFDRLAARADIGITSSRF